MTKPRVLIGTPLHGQPTLAYLNGIMSIMGDASLGCEFVPLVQRATYVNVGRNNLVDEARKRSCDEIIFLDADVGATNEHVRRLRSHDVDIVGGCYAKRVSGAPQWTAHAIEGQKPDARGLLECGDVPTGLLRIKMGVFEKLRNAFPHRFYQHDGDTEPRFEAFPIGLCEKGGHRHPAEARLDAILAICRAFEAKERPMVSVDLIKAVIGQKAASMPHLVGEDCQFSRLARHVGYTVWADLGCTARHFGEIGFPAEQTPL